MKKDKQIHIRIDDKEKERMIRKCEELGFKQLSEYLRFVGLNAETEVTLEKEIK